jgi:peptidoglycan hydrolase-like protein with peptidoglycan-binding domain
MRYQTRRLLIGLSVVAVTGASVLSQAVGAAGAINVAGRQDSGVGGAAVKTAVPGSVYVPTTAILTLGSRGPAVRALQQRLNFLHYYNGKPNGYFGWPTMEAAWAFKEVQSRNSIPKKPDIVGPAMQRQLQHPRLPQVLETHATWSRIEVNKATGVLVLYHGRRHIELISHVSTAAACRPDGCGWITPDGTYRAQAYGGYCAWDVTYQTCMYYAVFFITTLYAIHGMAYPTTTIEYDGVPLNAASHGCVRIPMDVAAALHKMIRINPSSGTRIYIAGPANQR